ncbi:MAG: hypothetical protein EOP84_17150 [Verrucomicrobiaceae bacterium]|nr:MAG: hypothetical protein EOP84_17150 [Verrucomicrobiaceae bacterium]
MHRLTKRHLILEWVPVEDVQFQRLIRFRENLFGDLTLQKCLEVFAEKFELLAQEPVADSGRTLLFFARKEG